jgi:hypothetical protein
MLDVIKPNVMLNVMLNVVMLGAIMLNVIVLNVIKPNGMLNIGSDISIKSLKT